MLNRFPRTPPSLAELLTDPLLATTRSTDLARAFNVSPRTVRRWKNAEAPASVRLALWAFSCHGLHLRQVEAGNLAALLAQLAPARGMRLKASNDEAAEMAAWRTGPPAETYRA